MAKIDLDEIQKWCEHCPDSGYSQTVLSLVAEVRRLKKGDFTPEEFQNLCHTKDDTDCKSFTHGCFAYWKKLGFNDNLLTRAIRALQAQEHYSEMHRDPLYPYLPANDPRYTPLIGEWDGFVAPELRAHYFHFERKRLRREVLDSAKEAGL